MKATAQFLSPLGGGVTNGGLGMVFVDSSNGSLIAGGSYYQIDTTTAYGLASWDGSHWDSVGVPLGCGFYSGAFFNGNKYAGDGCYFIYCWNAQGGFTFPVNGMVSVLKVINGELYAGGEFDSVAGIRVNRVAKFNGTSWQGFPPMDVNNPNDFSGPVLDLEFFNGELYAGGNFEISTPHMSDFCRFNGTAWVPAGMGFTGPATEVTSMEVFDNKLYVGGYFYQAQGDPADNLGIWDGTQWLNLGQQVGHQILDMEVLNNRLYFGGQFSSTAAGSCSFFSSWNGSTFRAEPLFNNMVTEIEAYQNKLYIGGPFDQVDSVSANWIVQYIPPPEPLEREWPVSRKALSIVPNPAHAHIAVEGFELGQSGGPIELHILDVSGRICFQSLYAGSEGLPLQTEVAALPAGLYVIRLRAGNEWRYGRFVKD